MKVGLRGKLKSNLTLLLQAEWDPGGAEEPPPPIPPPSRGRVRVGGRAATASQPIAVGVGGAQRTPGRAQAGSLHRAGCRARLGYAGGEPAIMLFPAP